MVFVLAVFAMGLAIAAYRTTEIWVRIFLICCCALNAIGAAKMIYEDYPYAYKLQPNDGQDMEPPYRR